MRRRLLIEFQGPIEEYHKLKMYFQQNSHIMRIIEKDEKEKIIKFNDLTIDLERREVLIKGERELLTTREFEILHFLASHPGQVFSHQQIYEMVWKNEYFQDMANITAHIGHIRKKIEPNPKCPIYIQTVRGVGYKFMEIY